jgi:hypothetical protein
MNFTLRSSSNPFNENERLTRKRQTTTTSTTLNRFLSFNENKSSSVENRRRLLQVNKTHFRAICTFFSYFSSQHQI